jgi:hypothetical protein
MTNYIIQGKETEKILTFAELMNADSDDECKSEQQQNICLISNKILDKTQVKLECGHSFNYINLYNEVKNQKGCDGSSINFYETDKLQPNCIKCPYCRKIFNYLLPCAYDIDGVQLKKFVNSPKKMTMNLECSFKKSDGEKCKLFSYITPNGHFCPTHYKKMINIKNVKSDEDKIVKKKKIKEELPYTKEMADFEKMITVAFLKAKLKENGGKVSGTKKELVQRIFKLSMTEEYFKKLTTMNDFFTQEHYNFHAST